MFLGFTNIEISNKHKLLFLNNLPPLFYQLLPFLRKMQPLPFFGEQTELQLSSPLKRGEDPAMTNQNYLFHIFVTTNKVSNNKNI